MIPDPVKVIRARFPTRTLAIEFLRAFEPVPGAFVTTDEGGIDQPRGGGTISDGWAIQPIDPRRPLERAEHDANGNQTRATVFDTFPGPPDKRRAWELIFTPWGDPMEAVAAAMALRAEAFTPGPNDQILQFVSEPS